MHEVKAGKVTMSSHVEEAAGFVSSGMWIDYGVTLCQPDVFDAALALRKDQLQSVKIRAGLTARPRAVLEADPTGEHFFWINLHFSGYDRKKHDLGIANYLPVHLGEIPDYYRRFIDPVDIVILKTCPMDANGYFNFSAANLWHHAVVERAHMVIVEESAGLPYVMGEHTGVHVSEVDRAVARLILNEIEDGSCLQIGIGGMPNAVCSLLRESSVNDLGIHTEMLTDGIIDLYQDGHISGAHKQLMPGKIVCTFALGSQSLYKSIDHNPDFHFCPVDHTNLPHIIMQNDRVSLSLQSFGRGLIECRLFS